MRILAFFTCCLLTLPSFAQFTDSAIVRLASVQYFDSIGNQCLVVAAPIGQVATGQVPFLSYPDEPMGQGRVPDSVVEKDCFTRFTMYNNDDTARELYFVPAYHLVSLRVFSASPSDIQSTFAEIPAGSGEPKDFRDCRLLRIGAGDTLVIFAKFNFVRSHVNRFSPMLIEKGYMRSWLMVLRNKDESLDIITYVATGIMLLMIIYSFAMFVQSGRREFAYYSAYALSTVAIMFLKSYLNFRPSAFSAFFEEYFDFIILCGGVFFYLSFIRKFLHTGNREEQAEKMIRFAEWALSALLLVFSAVYFFTDRFIILNILENYVIKLLILAISVMVIIFSFRKKDPFLNYLAVGNIAMIAFMMISLGIIIFRWKILPQYPGSVFNTSMLYYEIGLMVELVLFIFGLASKNRQDIISQVREKERFERESERREFEKQMAMLEVRQEERDRISADMHDDLGSGVTAIRLMSEIVKSKMNTDQYPEIDKISSSANELLGKMNAIIWTMKSSNDTVESLIAYLRAYATEYFDATPVSCTVEVKNVVEKWLSGEKRRNLFLSFKEVLNNILKHAQASKVRIVMEVDQEKLRISVHDNGLGIDLRNIRRFGNGLNNIKKRMQSMQAEFVIGNDDGTLVCFELSLH